MSFLPPSAVLTLNLLSSG